ncbi:Nuclear protein 96 [Phytophthora infestans]|uniref:Nuclear protein 96 n=1 Tax=Phytophthora infestans TaxID=4787 RepID=A0A8S9V701_PHYIN|nr:Nuclear protein 96 [Phytophthora infestans]
MSFGGFGNTSAPASGGFGGFGSSGTSGGFGGSAAASPFGGGATTGGFASGTSAFGAGVVKPAFGGFGAPAPATGGGFGSQQTTTTGFGGFGTSAAPSTGFGAAANPATTSGFGTTSTFGGGATTGGFGSSGTSAFGSSTPFGAKPAASSSPFGSTSAFSSGAGTTNAFGGGSTTGGFGTPTPASSGMFGGTTGGFGASAAKSPFGATSTATTGGFSSQATGTSAFGGFGSHPAAAVAGGQAQVQVGTGQPTYQPTREMEPSGTGGTANYISISRMQAFAHKSTEELRYEDYLKRTNPAAAQAAATQNAPAPGATTGGTGAFGGFGAQPATSSAFGSTGGFGSSQPSAFGATSTAGGFGSSSFGSTSTSATTGGFGGFGSQPATPATNGGLFGSTAAAHPATGAFGAPATSSAFGAAPGATPAFGAPATGGGFGSTTGGFGSSFSAAPAAQPQTGGFGGFGTTAPAAASGFGASAFGKPAASTGFGGFGASPAPAAAPATGGFGFGASQPQAGATTSLFGGASTPAPASTGFSFGATAPKPAATGAFGFGSTGGTSAFGSNPAGAFGASAAPSAFGATPVQPATGTTSLFGSTAGATGSTGGFGFGSTPSATPGATTSLFGAAKPASTGLFGSTTGSTTPGGLFGNTMGTGGSSLFGGANTAPSAGTTGFGFGGGGGFGSAIAGGFGNTSTPAAQTGGFRTAGSLFGQSLQPAQTAASQPQNLVAAPDVNPYGAGSFGAGLVEQNVKAALDLQSIKTGLSASSRLTAFANDVGLPRGPLEPPLVTRRQTVTNRHAIPVSFIRGSFKGSKSRFSTFTSPALPSALSRSGLESNGDSSTKEDEFKFTSSLFRNSATKKLVIDKSEQQSAQGNGSSSRLSVVPIIDTDHGDAHEIGSGRSRLLKPGDDGKYSVSFCNQMNKKAFSLRLYPNQTVKETRTEVKLLLRESSTSTASTIVDIELVLKGRIVHDTCTIEGLHLKEVDSIDVVVIEDRTEDKNREDQRVSISSMPKKPEAQDIDETVPPKRFMTYDEYLASASRVEDDGFKDTEANGTSCASPVSTSCPTLKNKDYFTIPSYERLQTMNDHELSQVEKFTVGCRGLGAVEWVGKTDVRDLDLDELVYFEKKEVIVYRDDEKKHPLGKGLNKPAIVELLGIFPPQRKSTSPDKYKERVKQRTQDIGATFLDYSIEKGIWRFRVEHFSRYGFDDDDDDNVDMDDHGDATGKKLLNADHLARKPEMTRGPAVSRGKVTFSADRSALFRQSGIFAGEVATTNAVATFGARHVLSTLSDKWAGTSDDSNSIKPATEFKMDLSVEEDMTVMKKDQRPTSEVFPVIPFTLKPLGVSSADHLKSEDKSTTYQMMLQTSNQGQAKVVRNQVDGGIFMARSFRCSWGPNGELVNLGRLTSRSEKYSDVENNGRRVCIEFPLRLSETSKSDLHDGLKLHYEYTSQGRNPNDFIDRDGSEVPAQYALPVGDLLMSCLHKYVAHVQDRAIKVPREKRTLLLWKLIQALWGQEHGAKIGGRPDSTFYPLASRDGPNEVESLDTFQTLDLRREAISQWFETALDDTEHLAAFDGNPCTEGVLRLLCQHRVAEASEMALECGDFRLATLLAQAASYEGNAFRNLMETQMAQWSENGSLEFMDKTLVLIYSILAGSVEVLTAQKGFSMSWIACLALFLWYKRGPATSLKSVMTLYEDAVRKQLASTPLSKFAPVDTDKDDVLMELMKLYIEDAASLCKVLSPSGFMSQGTHHLDYELSWHLHSFLRAIGYKLDREWESHIHQNFIRQLEGAGLWEDAVYVALNISDVIERENTCRELLFRNADVLASDVAKRELLCERLTLPPEWISEALAVRAVAKQERHEEIAHWMAARHYEEAHACLISHVAMSCLFANEKDVLMQLLLELEPVAVYVPQWKSCDRVDTIGGGLLLEYLRLEQQKGLEADHEDQFLQRVMLLSQQLSRARDASAKESDKKALLAQTCVSSMIVSLAAQAVQLRSLLSYTQERELADDASAISTPLELEPEFLGGLSHLVTGRETSFVETYRASQLMHLCSTFIDWRA